MPPKDPKLFMKPTIIKNSLRTELNVISVSEVVRFQMGSGVSAETGRI
jgi:hypothetical protein